MVGITLEGGHFLKIGQKDGNFLFCSTPEPMVTFLGLENISLTGFFGAPCIEIGFLNFINLNLDKGLYRGSKLENFTIFILALKNAKYFL